MNTLDVTTPTSINRDGDKDGGSVLSGPPPLPRNTAQRAKMNPNSSTGNSGSAGLGLGQHSADPFVRKMMALKGMEDSVRQMVAVDPSLSPILAQILQSAQSAVVQSTMSNAMSTSPLDQLMPPAPTMMPGAAPPPVGAGPVGAPATPPMPGMMPAPPPVPGI